MKQSGYIKSIRFFVGIILLINFNQVVSAQNLLWYLTGKETIGENPTFRHGDMAIGNFGELFLGSNQPRLQQKNTLFHIGNYQGEFGAKIYLSILDNSNNYGTRGFLDVVGTAVGSTEIILDMFDGWDGSPIDVARAHNTNSDTFAFTLQENIYNERTAQLKSRVEGNDRIWFIAEPIVETDFCLPIILQKKNNTLVIDNNEMHNGGYNFSYYKWYRNDELIHEGAHGIGLGGIYNTGRRSLSPYDVYHAIVIDQYGNEHISCPYNPTIFLYETRIIAYPNPTTISQSLVVVDVETGDEDVLIHGSITVFNVLGQRLGQVRTNGHRITPIQLPAEAGMYFLHFVSNEIQETIKIIVQ
ncbi:MAG: T9SS type A sorting domain-containing protein [Bacteroidales bacterium]|nr:T9SS type A sorting domain-containing protein [Bacteroidales bacterium]